MIESSRIEMSSLTRIAMIVRVMTPMGVITVGARDSALLGKLHSGFRGGEVGILDRTDLAERIVL